MHQILLGVYMCLYYWIYIGYYGIEKWIYNAIYIFPGSTREEFLEGNLKNFLQTVCRGTGCVCFRLLKPVEEGE